MSTVTTVQVIGIWTTYPSATEVAVVHTDGYGCFMSPCRQRIVRGHF